MSGAFESIAIRCKCGNVIGILRGSAVEIKRHGALFALRGANIRRCA